MAVHRHDVASAYTWAELHASARNPLARWTSALARRVAQDLASRGWSLEAVMSDNASEFRSAEFVATVERLGAEHRRIRAGRPQTNGCVERVQLTILDECWKPAFARFLIPKMTRLARDLAAYLAYRTPTAPTPAAGPREGPPSWSSAKPSVPLRAAGGCRYLSGGGQPRRNSAPRSAVTARRRSPPASRRAAG